LETRVVLRRVEKFPRFEARQYVGVNLGDAELSWNLR
jgi:hypothetical protein